MISGEYELKSGFSGACSFVLIYGSRISSDLKKVNVVRFNRNNIAMMAIYGSWVILRNSLIYSNLAKIFLKITRRK